MRAYVKANNGFRSEPMPVDRALIYAYELKVLGNKAKVVMMK